MQTLRRTVAVLTFPAIAYLGAACERTDTPTEARQMPSVAAQFSQPINLVVDDDGFASLTDCNAATPTPYTTISAAVAAATPGQTIGVCPSTYPLTYVENVTIGMSLTLLGAQSGNPVAGRTFGGPLESTVSGMNMTASVPVFRITAPNVTIDGFSVTNTVVSGDAFGIGTGSGFGSGAVITNNIIHNVITPDQNGAAQAIYLQNGPDNVSILGNDIDNVRSNRSAKGVFIGDAASTNASTNILIQGNSITNVTSVRLPPSTILSRGAYGILINNGNGSTSNSGLRIQDNTINTLSSAGGWVHAIGLEANTPGVLVQGNTISILAPAPFGTIAVWFESENTLFYTGHVNCNNLDVTILNFGIAVDPALSGGPVDGTFNWWGDPNGPGPVGPGAGAQVSPNVDFTPWLHQPAPSGACAAGGPSLMATGGGQISVTMPDGRGSFGFSAKQNSQSGHLDYMNHASRAHLNCTVDVVTIVISPTKKAHLEGMCSSNNYTGTFMADVEDNANPGKGADKFTISYGTVLNEGGTLVSGNINIH